MLQLPCELVISILSYLPLSTLSNLLSTSREWNIFFEANQSTLYHNAAVLYGFIPSESILYSELEAIQHGRDMRPHHAALSRRSLIGVSDWKSFCCKQIRIRDAWRGEASSRVTAHISAGTLGNNVHRIKADEHRGFVIVTSSDGGLLVVDLDEDKVLWSLPRTYVHSYAHCEYDSGYLIFDRLDGDKEVWRVADDAGMSPDTPTFASPDERQNNMSSLAAELHGFPLSSRGHFKPWMVLKPPEPTRAFRLVFPALLAATSLSLLIWDVSTGELAQVIRDIQRSPDGVGSSTSLGSHVNYVEVSAKHALVCGSNTLRVFSRASGRCVLDISSKQVSYGINTYFFPADRDPRENWLPNSVLKPQPVSHHRVVVNRGSRPQINEFIAVHVSSCGSHLAALLSDSRLVVIPFFETIISGEVDIKDTSLDIQVGSPTRASKYLAFENGRVAVATGTGVFIVNLDFESIRGSLDPPRVTVHRAAWFNTPVGLRDITCLQMTPTCLFLNWEAHEDKRVYRDDDVIPKESNETRYLESLNDTRRVGRLPTGEDMIQLFEPAGVQDTCTLFSIDFAPIVPS